MGDRAQVKISDRGGAVYLYTHWTGYSLPETVREAIARRLCWNDAEYLARMVFCGMLAESSDALGGETGYGIGWGWHGDIGCAVVLDTEKLEARFYESAQVWSDRLGNFEDRPPAFVCSFETLAGMDQEQLDLALGRA